MNLPPNITIRHGSYCAAIERGGQRYQKIFSGLTPESLAAAVAWLAPIQQLPITQQESNTGHVGITETERWIKDRPHKAFQTCWSINGQAGSKYFYFGKNRTRAEALQLAIAHRKRMDRLSAAARPKK